MPTPILIPPQEPVILIERLAFPEGPAFDLQGNLWCTEMDRENLVRYIDGQAERIPTGGRPNGLLFDSQGMAWVCDSSNMAIRTLDPASGTWQTIVERIDGAPLQNPNDLIFDTAGNLLFTCPEWSTTEPIGYLACLRPDGTLLKIAEGLFQPNGLALIDGGKNLIVAETFKKRLLVGSWDSDKLAWNDPHPWADVGGDVGPDGMAYDDQGILYVAVYGGGVVRAVDHAGKVLRDYPLPGHNPTNVALDPSGKLGMVVTEAEKGLLLSFPNTK